MASTASVSEVLSTFTRNNLLPVVAGRSKSALALAELGSRTVPMTVVSGRERYFVTKPLPMPGREVIHISDTEQYR
jgi:hypothetical protein